MFILFQSPLVSMVVVLTLGLFVSIVASGANKKSIRQIPTVTSLLALFIGLLSCLAFDKSNLGFQFLYQFNVIPEYNLALTLGADGLSMVFLLLTLFIFPLLFLSA